MAITVERKYGALRAIGIILKVLAIILLVVSVIAGLGAMAQSGASSIKGDTLNIGPGVAGLMMIVWGVLSAISLWAGAELINLLIDVEENTRKTHILLERERN